MGQVGQGTLIHRGNGITSDPYFGKKIAGLQLKNFVNALTV